MITPIRKVGIVKHGRNNVAIWLCRCGCGNILEVDQGSLTKGIVAACKTCRRGPCVICGAKITNEEYSVKRNTCSDICRAEQVKQKHRRFYSNCVEKDKDYNKKRWAHRLEKDFNLNKKRYQSYKERLLKLPTHERDKTIKKLNHMANMWRRNWIKRAKVECPEAYHQFIEKRRMASHRYRIKKNFCKLTNDNKENAMSIKKSVRLVDATMKECQSLSENGSVNWSGSLNEIAKRYAIYSEHCLPDLSDAEKHAIAQAYNGRIVRSDIAEEIKMMHWVISEALKFDPNVVELLQSENIEPIDFYDRVESFTQPERLAIIFYVNHFWNDQRQSFHESED